MALVPVSDHPPPTTTTTTPTGHSFITERSTCTAKHLSLSSFFPSLTPLSLFFSLSSKAQARGPQPSVAVKCLMRND